MAMKFLGRLFQRGTSKDTAKKRLQLTLVYDRLSVSDHSLQEMQNEIVAVISRYFIIDENQLELDIRRNDDLTSLRFNSPIISAKIRPRIV